MHFRAFLHVLFVRYFIELQPFGHFLTASQDARGVQLPPAFRLWITPPVRDIRRRSRAFPAARTSRLAALTSRPIRHGARPFYASPSRGYSRLRCPIRFGDPPSTRLSNYSNRLFWLPMKHVARWSGRDHARVGSASDLGRDPAMPVPSRRLGVVGCRARRRNTANGVLSWRMPPCCKFVQTLVKLRCNATCNIATMILQHNL